MYSHGTQQQTVVFCLGGLAFLGILDSHSIESGGKLIRLRYPGKNNSKVIFGSVPGFWTDPVLEIDYLLCLGYS